MCCKNSSSGLNDKSELDYLVCTCMEVMRSDIIEAIQSGDDTFEKLSDKLGVGTGCTSCVEEVHEILSTELKKC